MSGRPVVAVIAILIGSLAPFVVDGTYTVDFTEDRTGPRDTLVVAGRFDIPE